MGKVKECLVFRVVSSYKTTSFCNENVVLGGLPFSLGTPVSSNSKSDCHDITEILLKVSLNTINQSNQIPIFYVKHYKPKLLKFHMEDQEYRN
jgi:hypothetical protein